MAIALIVGLSENYCIGNHNQLPWRQSADLQRFKRLTMGKPVIMGRKTYESIGKPLPGRANIIVTRDKNYQAEGCIIEHSLEQAVENHLHLPEFFIIGGEQIFKEALPLADRMYLTWIHAQIEGDAFFPKWATREWREVEREDHTADEKNEYDYSFVKLERRLSS